LSKLLVPLLSVRREGAHHQRVEVPPEEASTPSVAIWRGRRVTGGLEAQRKKASKGG
jgi:hypothetical protein